MMVELKRISTALGLLAALTGSALAQGPAPNANQVTADSVAGTLRSSRDLAGYRIEIQARDGVVTLTGELGSPAQKAEALARTQYVAGVRSVVDQLQVANDRIRSHCPVPAQSCPVPAQSAVQPMALGHGHGGGIGPAGGDVDLRWRDRRPNFGGPVTSGPVSGGPISDGGPMPEGPAGMAGATQAVSARAVPTTHGPAMLLILTFRRLAIRRPTRGKPGRTSDRSTLIRKFRSTGGP